MEIISFNGYKDWTKYFTDSGLVDLRSFDTFYEATFRTNKLYTPDPILFTLKFKSEVKPSEEEIKELVYRKLAAHFI